MKDNISDADASSSLQQVVTIIIITTLTLAMAEHRDGRFRYEVPLATSIAASFSYPHHHQGSMANHNKHRVSSGGAHRTSSYGVATVLHNHRGRSRSSKSHRHTTSSTKTHEGISKRHRSRSTNSLLREYTINSTIHGVKYLGGPERPWPERVWWIVMFVISISVCSALIMNTYKKWTSDPVIVSFSQTPTPVWKIPFPAVTICPTNIVRQSQFNFTDILTKVQDRMDGKVNLTATE